MPNKRYVVRSRFLVKDQGWKIEDIEVEGDFQVAGAKASQVAHVLDGIYGDSHFWTVDVCAFVDGESDGLGSYYQLFHGRLS